MEKVLITEVCDIFVGRTPSRYNPFYWGTGFPWLSIADMNQGESLSSTKETITTEAVKECKCKIVPKGTVLFSFKLSIGKVGITAVDMFTNEAIAAFLIKDKSRLDTKFLFYTLKSTDYSVGSNKAVMGKTLNKEQLKKFTIPLPPIEDQRRIVKILDQAQSLIEKRKQAIALLDDYIKAVFLDMFGDPVNNPKGWERRTLSELLIKIESGHSPVCLDRPMNIGEWGVLKLGAITTCYFIPTENKALPESLTPNIALEVKVGDVLFSRKNTYDLVAASAYIFETPPRLMMSDLIFRLVPKDVKILNPIYLQALISTSSKRKKIQQLAGGAAGSMPNISKGKLLSQQIELPPPDLQEKYSFVVAKVWQLKNQMKTQLFELENNFQAQLKRSFRGE